MTPIGLLQAGATLALNAGFAWLIGSLLARRWLGGSNSRLLDRTDIVASVACMAGSLLALWVATALMGEVGLSEALAMLPAVLVQTAYGQAGLAGMVIAGVMVAVPHRYWRVRVLLLALFALARASTSHAGEHGLASIAVGVEWMHLVLVGVWLGGVGVAAWVVRPMPATYLASLSTAATVALGGIVATGLFNVFQRIAAVDQMVSDPYGVALTVKLVLFAGAAGLGAYNRFVGFPRALGGQPARALLVLRIESLVLLAALAAAAVLVSTQPPA